MRSTDRLSQPQKIVVVLALGMAFGAAGTYLVGLGNTSAFGWYAYAPLSQATYPAAGLHGWARLLIWLALIAPVGAAVGPRAAPLTGTSPARLTAFRSPA